MAIQLSVLGDIAGRFDISDEEAQRICDCVNSEAEFVKIWENQDWWTDERVNEMQELRELDDLAADW